MIQLLLVVCCVVACPILMGGVMVFMGRDHSAAKLEREVRRLNRTAARRHLAMAVASPFEDSLSQHAAQNSADELGPPEEESSALAAG